MIASSSVLFRNSVFFGNEKFIFPIPSWFRNSVFFGGGKKKFIFLSVVPKFRKIFLFQIIPLLCHSHTSILHHK